MPMPKQDKNKNAYTHKIAERDRGERRLGHGTRHTSWWQIALIIFFVTAFVAVVYFITR